MSSSYQTSSWSKSISRELRILVGLSLATVSIFKVTDRFLVLSNRFVCFFLFFFSSLILPCYKVVCVWTYDKFYVAKLPVQVEGYISQAISAEKNGDFSRAVQLYTKALQIIKSSPFTESSQASVLFSLAQAQSLAGHPDVAEKTYEKILNKSFNKAKMITVNNTNNNEKGLRTDSQWRGLVYERLAQLAQNRGDRMKALALYVESLEALVGNPSVLEKIVKQDKPTTELLGSRTAKEVAGVLNNIGMLYLEVGENIAARNVFERCLAVVDICVNSEELRLDAEFRRDVDRTRDICKKLKLEDKIN